jgi:hypothetical protein
MVLLPDSSLGLRILVGEVSPETRAKVDVPPPEATLQGFGILVVMSPEPAGLAREFLFSHNCVLFNSANLQKKFHLPERFSLSNGLAQGCSTFAKKRRTLC